MVVEMETRVHRWQVPMPPPQQPPPPLLLLLPTTLAIWRPSMPDWLATTLTIESNSFDITKCSFFHSFFSTRTTTTRAGRKSPLILIIFISTIIDLARFYAIAYFCYLAFACAYLFFVLFLFLLVLYMVAFVVYL